MDETIMKQLAIQDQKIDALYTSVEKTRKYLLIIMWSSLAMIVLPLLAGALLVPYILSSFTASMTGFL